jgi:ELWxxDGT repeat protein
MALALAALSLQAQSPYLVTDLNPTATTPSSSNPSTFQVFGDTLFFSAATTANGRELWKYSGGTASMVKEIYDGSGSASPDWLTDIGGGVLLFRATDSGHGSELWRTDGTAAGTMLVKDIRPGSGGSSGGVFRGPQAVFHGKLFFVANDNIHGFEPWFSNGTDAGTQMLLDLNGTAATSIVTTIAVLGDHLLIFGADGLWTSDGTAAGTTQIATIGNASGLAVIDSTVYFTATSELGRELWTSDGTAAGTHIVADIAAGSASGMQTASLLRPVGSTLYFTAAADSIGIDLWKSDGTAAGTQFVKTLIEAGGASPSGLVTPDGTLYIEASSALWRSDGTAAGTVVVEASGVVLYDLAFGGAVYYLRQTATGMELWSTHGATTNLVTALAGASELTFAGGKLYFNGWDAAHGAEPWVCEDGTAATTHRLANINPDILASSYPKDLTAAGNLLFFHADDGFSTGNAFRSDGTSGGTFALTAFPNNASPAPLTGWHGAAWFRHGFFELWRSDGTVAGTGVMKDFTSYGGTSALNQMFAGSRYLYFNASDGSRTWRTDGTPAGTVVVGEDLPYELSPDRAGMFAELAGRVYLAAGNSKPGIWVTDGDPGTTRRIFTVPYSLASISELTTGAGAVFFTTSTAENGQELWRSDGTFGSGSMVRDIAPGSGSSLPAQLTAAGRYLYFVADDGTNGAELWRTDGTEGGTILLKDIAAGGGSSSSNLTAAGAFLYFSANDGVHGVELWRSDGTPAGTVMVADLRPGSGSANPHALSFANGTLWFTADDGVAGEELWKLAGETPAMVADLAPGAQPSSPFSLVQAGQLLFFTADTPAAGRELWAMPLTAEPLLSIDDVRIVEGTGGTRTMRFTVTRGGSTSGAAGVAFATSDGTASPDDYVARNGTLAFAAGETARFVDVVVNADAIIEGPESLYVTLSTPSGALLARSIGTGIIDDDDHRAELSIVELPYTYLARRHFRITNAGPSAATDVRLRFSESPRNMQRINISGIGGSVLCSIPENPAACTLDSLAAGAVFDVDVETSPIGFVDPSALPGSTVTADVSAAEIDSNPSDNLVSHMLSFEGMLTLPPFLTSGSSTTVAVTLQYDSTISTTVTLSSSSSNVVVSPDHIVIAPHQSAGSFTLTVGAATGPVKLTAQPAGWPPGVLTVPVVASGATPKLDVAIVATGSHVVYGDAVTVAVEVAARRHDGTRPTGTVSLLDANLAVVAQQSLDSGAKTVFTLNGQQPGRRTYSARYQGDANFNPLDGATALVTVDEWPVEIDVTVPPMICAGTTHQIVIIVRTSATPNAPTGSVNVSFGSGAATSLALTPTGTPGQSRAVLQRPFSAGETHVSVEYVPTGTFRSWSATRWYVCAACAPMNVRATATSTTSVAVTWSALAGADHYQLVRFNSATSSFGVGTATATNMIDSGLAPMRSYLYTVTAFDSTGYPIAYAAPDVATTMLFTNDPLVARTTPVRASHLQELRIGANGLRWFGVSADITAVTPVPVGSAIRAADLTALRADLTALRLGLGLPPIAFTDPTLTAATPIKAVHIEELRQAIK